MRSRNLARRNAANQELFFVALQVLDVFVIFFAAVGHDAIDWFTARERARDRPRLGEKNRIVIGDRPLQLVVIDFL